MKVDRLVQTMEERRRLHMENRSLRVENTYLKEGLDRELEPRYGAIIGQSEAMEEVYRWIDRVARSESTVMIYGSPARGRSSSPVRFTRGRPGAKARSSE